MGTCSAIHDHQLPSTPWIGAYTSDDIGVTIFVHISISKICYFLIYALCLPENGARTVKCNNDRLLIRCRIPFPSCNDFEFSVVIHIHDIDIDGRIHLSCAMHDGDGEVQTEIKDITNLVAEHIGAKGRG